MSSLLGRGAENRYLGDIPGATLLTAWSVSIGAVGTIRAICEGKVVT
ncbi:hypothetical protein M3J09_012288 [Ascochyta lentis]